MAKDKRQYICQQCGSVFPKWSGQCGECGAWNSIEESKVQPVSDGGRFANWSGSVATVVSAANINSKNEALAVPSGLSELDRVLGGGLVAGAVVLLGGDPGIGKSTLLLQAIVGLPTSLPNLYISGEESLEQISARARRLQLPLSRLRLLAETCVERILATLEDEKAKVIVIDSIQTIYSEQLTAAPGGVSQIRESAAQLVRFAKQTQTAVLIVGHVTKEGALAGPRVLEHMVDTVLYFESELSSRYRLVRAVKNRFGPVNELGIFAMTEQGLLSVDNPSKIFLSGHSQPVSGAVIMVTREGTRPLLVELQALVDASRLNLPRRVALGFDVNRLSMLLAVAHRHGGLALYDQDVFINIVGGMRIPETAADLPVLAAVWSSFRNAPLPQDLVIFGEVGLAGEVRPVPHGQERLKEAMKQGFTRAILPKLNAPRPQDAAAFAEMTLFSVASVSEALSALRDI